MPFGLNGAPPPAPMIWKKGGGGEGKGKKQAVVLVDMPVIAPKGRDGGGSLQPLLGGALTPAAPVGPRPRHSQRLPAADR